MSVPHRRAELDSSSDRFSTAMMDFEGDGIVDAIVNAKASNDGVYYRVPSSDFPLDSVEPSDLIALLKDAHATGLEMLDRVADF